MRARDLSAADCHMKIDKVRYKEVRALVDFLTVVPICATLCHLKGITGTHIKQYPNQMIRKRKGLADFLFLRCLLRISFT